MGIPYEADKVQQHLIDSGVWPAGDADEPGVTAARDWWVRLVKQVTYGVNDHPWDETEYVEDAVTEISGNAVDQMVGEARKSRALMRLCDLSNVHDLDVEDEVEMRLHNVITSDPTKGMYRYGNGETDQEYRERKARKQQAHREQVSELLKLKSVAKIYLESAAVTVARPWCEAQVKRCLTQWRCEACDDTFVTESQADGEECEAAECTVHDDGEDNCDGHDCVFPHSLVQNDTE